MDSTIKNLIIGAVIIAAIATIIAMGATLVINYWPYLVGIIVVGIVLYVLKTKARDQKNKV
jgi:hypothetical protein